MARVRWEAMLPVLFAAAACSDDAPTRIDAVVLVGEATSPSITRLRLEVVALRGDGEAVVREASIEPLRQGDRLLPWTTRVSPEHASDVGETIHRFRAIAVRDDGRELPAQHRVSFLAGAVLTLPLRIDDACLDVTCGANETCIDGACADDRIDPCTLEGGGATHSACVRPDGGAVPGDAAMELPPMDPVAQLSCGDHTACVRLASGAVRCWGSNFRGLLSGDLGRALFVATEIPVPAHVIDISVGMETMCVVFEDARVACWGRPVGSGETLPAGQGHYIDELAGATHVAASNESICAIRDGRPVCIGHPDGSWSALEGLVSIDSSWTDTCALDGMRTLHCWSTQTGVDTPIERVSAFSIGANGRAFVIGGGGSCELSPPWFRDGVDRVTAGTVHCCMRLRGTDEGRVVCQGRVTAGALGADLESPPAAPILVPGLDQVVDVDAGQFYSCALRADGTVWCWGTNENGQIGNGGNGDHDATPARVRGLP